MSRYKDDDDFKNFLQENAPVPPTAAPGAMEKTMSRVGLSPSGARRSFKNWLVPLSAVAAFALVLVIVAGSWTKINPEIPIESAEVVRHIPVDVYDPEESSMTAELTWGFLDDDEPEAETIEIGTDFLLLAAAAKLEDI